MRYTIAVLGFILVLIVMWDAFETIISPRRITSRFRFARFFYRVTWWSRSDVAQRIKDDAKQYLDSQLNQSGISDTITFNPLKTPFDLIISKVRSVWNAPCLNGWVLEGDAKFNGDC